MGAEPLALTSVLGMRHVDYRFPASYLEGNQQVHHTSCGLKVLLHRFR
jgi:hypothetical protein